MRTILFLIAFLPAAALGADGPEAVYDKLHRATLAGDVEGVLAQAAAARREEIAALPGREDMVRMLAMTLPQTYTVTSREVSGRRAVLALRGVHERTGPARGMARLVRERGEWKVEHWSWDSAIAESEPTIVRVQMPAVPPKGMEKDAPSRAPAGEAQSETAASEEPVYVPVEPPTLRRVTEKELPCVIKPVMTDDDLRRCGATPPKYD